MIFQMRVDYLRQFFGGRRLDLQAQGGAQGRGGKVALAVAGHDDEGKGRAADSAEFDFDGVVALEFADLYRLTLFQDSRQLRDFILALLEDVEQVVGQIDVALIDLVNQQRARFLGRQHRAAERPER